MAKATIKEISAFFKTGDPKQDSLSNFAQEWKALSDDAKEQLREGIGNGTLTY